MSLCDTRNLAEFTSEDYPGERLVACYNPLLAEDRKRTREELLAATEARLQKIADDVARRTKKLLSADAIGVKVDKAVNRHKVGKHFILTIRDSLLRFERGKASIAREAQLDGIYIIRTSESADAWSAGDTVRPIRHRSEAHVRAHIFLCMLAHYAEWHMRQVLSSVLFQDEELDAAR